METEVSPELLVKGEVEMETEVSPELLVKGEVEEVSVSQIKLEMDGDTYYSHTANDNPLPADQTLVVNSESLAFESNENSRMYSGEDYLMEYKEEPLNCNGNRTTYTRKRNQTVEKVEKLLVIWITKKQLAGDSISEAEICKKAKQLHTDILQNTPEMSAHGDDFKVSRGWLNKFKIRNGINNGVRNEEASSSNKHTIELNVTKFKEYVETEGFIPQQVFNWGETGLYWKKLPKRTYITHEEMSLPGHKPMKDRVKLLLCGNASGDFKVKPLLVYHSHNPKAFRKNNVRQRTLNVMWRSNIKACITRQFFIEWVDEVFGPSVKKYLQEKQLPLKALLLIDNAHSHLQGFEKELPEELSFLTVKFLPRNMTTEVQPMEQQVILNFKQLYTKVLFQRCFEVTSDMEITVRDYWKNHFNILHCLSLIDEAWGKVSSRTMISAWRRLWPDSVPERNFEGFEPEPVVMDIVSLGKSMGLDFSEEDVEELVDDHSTDLTKEELNDLLKELERGTVEEILSKDEGRKCIPTCLIKEICTKWGEVRRLVEELHPDIGVTNRATNIFNENVISHFRHRLKRRQKQSSLNMFSAKKSSSEVITSAAKRQRLERTPMRQSPDIIGEADSTSKQ